MIKFSIPPTLQEKLDNLTSVQRAMVFAATFIILGGAFYFLRYKPDAQHIAGLKANIKQQENRLVELKRAAAQVEVLQKEVAGSEKELAQLLSMLPDQKEIPGLLDSVSQLGAQVGLENILFQPQPEQIQEFYAIIPIRLDLLGRYHELGTFFDQISKLNRILNVENLTITRRNDSSLQVGCTIVTYRFLEKAEQAREAKPKK
jgi:type IV pilus assembly protein PilO